jgi:hypothetical protein
MNRSKIFKWYKRLTEGREIIYDKSHAGRPLTLRNVEIEAEVREIIRSDRHMTIR